MLTVPAPAKLNLTLEVLGKRGDGFHEIRSVMQTLKLCDRLTFQLAKNIEFRCDSGDWQSEHSLVSRAVRLVQESTGCKKGVSISINKRIPLVAGLGGDSSDAAAVLRGLNILWNLGLPRGELLRLAGCLGSDVAFFLYGGTALAEGRGEILSPLPPLPRIWIVLVMPTVPGLPGKTGQLYALLKANHYTDGQFTRNLVDTLKGRREFTSALLFNTFENVAFDRFSGLSVSREHMLKSGANGVHLAGSGPALFTLVAEMEQAEELCRCLKAQKLDSCLTEPLPALEEMI